MEEQEIVIIPFVYACEGIVRAAYDCERYDKEGANSEEYAQLQSLYESGDSSEELKREAIECAIYISNALKFAIERFDNKEFTYKINSIIRSYLIVPSYSSIENSFTKIFEAFDLVDIRLPNDIVGSFL